jgi:hypothetical protein
MFASLFSKSREVADEEEDEEQQSLLGGGPSAVKEAVKARLGLAPAQPAPTPTRLQRLLHCIPELSYTTRLAGFSFCFIIGWLLTLTSISALGSLLLGNPLPFAFKYTVGNVLSTCAFCFLQGPARQCAGMCAAERRLATTFYLGSFAATLFCVFHLRSRLWTILALF